MKMYLVVIASEVNQHIVLARLLALTHPLQDLLAGDGCGGIAGGGKGRVPGFLGGFSHGRKSSKGVIVDAWSVDS